MIEKWKSCAANQTPVKQDPIVYLNTELFDIKTWLSPFISKFKGHTGPHCYHFTRDTENNVVFKYKKWSSGDDDWLPNGQGIQIFKVVIVQ